jgi:aconitase A
MLSSVLRSERAVQVNIAIMRAFVQMRRLSSTNQELAWKLTQLEQKYDMQFEVIFDAIERLIAEPPSPERRMGFRAKKENL